MDNFPYYTMEGGKMSIGPGVFFKKCSIARLWMAFSLENFGRSFAAFTHVTAGLLPGGTSAGIRPAFFHAHRISLPSFTYCSMGLLYSTAKDLPKNIRFRFLRARKPPARHGRHIKNCFSKKISINLFKGMAPQRAGAEPSAQSTGFTVGGDRPGCRPQPDPVKPPPLREKWRIIWRNL